tara:strand:+ start:2708 stop:2821 length:114 start_codon:yes stop_codon:yes gene_type:complete
MINYKKIAHFKQLKEELIALLIVIEDKDLNKNKDDEK